MIPLKNDDNLRFTNQDTINATMFHFNFDDQTTFRLEGHNPACHSVGLN